MNDDTKVDLLVRLTTAENALIEAMRIAFHNEAKPSFEAIKTGHALQLVSRLKDHIARGLNLPAYVTWSRISNPASYDPDPEIDT